MPRRTEPSRIVISHASDPDGDIANRLCAFLRSSCGAECYCTSESRPGYWDKDLKRQLRGLKKKRGFLILLASPVALTRPFVQQELGHAVVENVSVIPIFPGRPSVLQERMFVNINFYTAAQEEALLDRLWRLCDGSIGSGGRATSFDRSNSDAIECFKGILHDYSSLHRSNLPPVKYDEGRGDFSNVANMLDEAEAFVKWSSLNFGVQRFSRQAAFFEGLERVLDRNDRIKIDLLFLHPGAFLPQHLSIALGKTDRSANRLEDVRVRALGAVRAFQGWLDGLNYARKKRVSVRCTRFSPRWSILATDKRLKVEFYPSDGRAGIDDRVNIYLGPPKVAPEESFWMKDFDDIWDGKAALVESRWLEGFDPSCQSTDITFGLDHESLSGGALNEIEKLLKSRPLT